MEDKKLEKIVKKTTDVANAICRKKGYFITYKEADVAVILTAYFTIEGQKK